MRYYLFKKSQVLLILFLFIGLLFIPLSNYPAFSKTIIVEHQIDQIGLYEISENNGALSGYVTDPLMNPIKDALIRVYFHGDYEEDYSDENGYYHVTNIPICYCMKNITCSKVGYKTELVKMGITENTIHDFILFPLDVYPIFEGSQCNGWWNSPITVSFVFDPEEVAEIWYYYYGWHLYTEPFIIDEKIEIKLEWYWIDFEGNQSHFCYEIIYIDRVPPTIDIKWDIYKKNCQWYVKFILTGEDVTSGMSPNLDFFINDVLQGTYQASWPSFEIDIIWSKELKKALFGFGCSDNACNYVIEKVDGSDIKSIINSQRILNHKSLNILLQPCLEWLIDSLLIYQKFILSKYVANF